MEKFKILCFGDIVGPATLEAFTKNLPQMRKKYGADMVIVNGENVSEGNGIMPDEADALIYSGVDVITGGNHIWQKNRIFSYLDEKKEIIRPANYPPSNPGRGYMVVDMGCARVLVMNVLGTVFTEPLACPFDTVDKILEKEKGNYDISVLDVHAEATAEKKALAYYLDGRINVIFGTHTHVTTADEQILPKGSGYITDLGMCGCEESCLGVESGIIIDKLKNKMPARFKLADGKITLNGALFELGRDFRVTSVSRIKESEL